MFWIFVFVIAYYIDSANRKPVQEDAWFYLHTKEDSEEYRKKVELENKFKNKKKTILR